jgi:hypothetical protein
MSKIKKSQLGALPARYHFILNPYPDFRVSLCPYCKHKTGQRKIPLLIHVAPVHLIALKYTCRYCTYCDLLIANKHEVEEAMTAMFIKTTPGIIGNKYLIVGTVENTAWRKGLKQPILVEEMLPYASDFVQSYKELRMSRLGWYKADQEPPIREPPPSQDWVAPGATDG